MSLAAISASARRRTTYSLRSNSILRHARPSPAHEDLLDIRLRRARLPADRVAVHRRIAPAENRQPFFAGDALDDSFAQQPLLRLHRQEHHADAVGARLGQRETQLRAFARKELVRDLDQNAGAVARLRIAAASAAMRQVDQDLDALADDVVRLLGRSG